MTNSPSFHLVLQLICRRNIEYCLKSRVLSKDDQSFRRLETLSGILVRQESEPVSAICPEKEARQILKLAKRHRVQALISDKSWCEFKNIKSELEKMSAQRAQRHFLQIADLAYLAKLMKAEGVPFLLLKGAAISERFYDKPHQRHSNDIDILVAHEHITHVLNILLSTGNAKTRPYFEIEQNLISMVQHKTSDFDVLSTMCDILGG